METAFEVKNGFHRALNVGHKKVKGHELSGYYRKTEVDGVVKLVRVCCNEDKEA